jgi:hypothetical protein
MVSLRLTFGTLGSFLLAIYSYLGFVILLVFHAVWYESLTELGLPVYYHFTLKESMLLSIYFLPSIVMTFVMTSKFKRKKFSLSFFKNLPDETYALISSIFNTIIIFVSFTSLLYFIPNFFTPSNIIFMFVFTSVIGISTFYYIGPEPLKILYAGNYARYIEALKLQHDWFLRAINIIIWAIVIFSTGVVLVIWTQIVFPWIPVEKRFSYPFIKLQAWSTVQVIYLLLGVWFGILYRLMKQAWHIRKRIAGIE